MTPCIFCKIAKKEIPKEFIYETNDVLGFADINPSAPIHYLFIPAEHIQSIAHLEGNHAEVLSKIIFAAKSAAEKLGLKGYKLVFNVGREGGQVIDHLHLHLLGGWRKREDKDGVDVIPHPSMDK